MEKKILTLESWEIDHLNSGLKYLIDSHLSSPGAISVIPGDKIKSISWLIAFQLSLDERTKVVGHKDKPLQVITR